MKRIFFLLITCLCWYHITAQDLNKEEYPEGAITTIEELKKEFREPSKEYGTIPFFVWNGKISKPDIDSFMLDFRDAGCGGVFIHTRPRLNPLS